MSDVLDGVLGVVDTEAHQLPQPKVAKTEKVETKTPEAPKPEPKEETKKVETPEPDEDEEVIDTQDFSRTPKEESDTTPEPTTEPSKTETEKTKEAETTDDWKPNLPAAPQFNLPAPEVNADGYIVNMTQEQYQTYLIEKAKFEMRTEAYHERFENQALDAAEKLLPEIKTNAAIRTLVQNAREASILTGKQINSYEAAKLVKEALGITSTKLAEAKAEGAQNAKTSITIQKKAAVETTGSTKKKAESPQGVQLAKRLKAGDEEAFVQLLSQWDKDGKLS